MEIHFYEQASAIPEDKTYYSGWYETDKAIQDRNPYIVTTQMGLLSTGLIEAGYRIFVHPATGKSYELKLGANTCTDKEIRFPHNLFRMWEAGAFYEQP